MADLKIRSPYPIKGTPTNFPMLLLVDEGDGTYSLKLAPTGSTVAARITCPYPSMTDPTQFVDIGLADNGDGTYAPIVEFV